MSTQLNTADCQQFINNGYRYCGAAPSSWTSFDGRSPVSWRQPGYTAASQWSETGGESSQALRQNVFACPRDYFCVDVSILDRAPSFVCVSQQAAFMPYRTLPLDDADEPMDKTTKTDVLQDAYIPPKETRPDAPVVDESTQISAIVCEYVERPVTKSDYNLLQQAMISPPTKPSPPPTSSSEIKGREELHNLVCAGWRKLGTLWCWSMFKEPVEAVRDYFVGAESRAIKQAHMEFVNTFTRNTILLLVSYTALAIFRHHNVHWLALRRHAF